MDEQPNEPEEAPQPGHPQSPEDVPAEAPPESGNAFRDILGATISDVSYEPLGSNGGKIKISTSNSHVPLEISWVGPKVTVRQTDGDVIMLSSDAPEEQ